MVDHALRKRTGNGTGKERDDKHGENEWYIDFS